MNKATQHSSEEVSTAPRQNTPRRSNLKVILVIVVVVCLVAGIVFMLWSRSGTSDARSLEPIRSLDVSELGENPRFVPLTEDSLVAHHEDFTLARVSDNDTSHLVGIPEQDTGESVFFIEVSEDSPCSVGQGVYVCGSVAFDPDVQEAAEIDNETAESYGSDAAMVPAERANTANEESAQSIAEELNVTLADDITSLEAHDTVVVADGTTLAGRSGDNDPWSVELGDRAAELNGLGHDMTTMVLASNAAIYAEDGAVRVLDSTTGEQLTQVVTSFDSWVVDEDSLFLQRGNVIEEYDLSEFVEVASEAAATSLAARAADAYRAVLADPQQYADDDLQVSDDWAVNHALVAMDASADESTDFPQLVVSFRDQESVNTYDDYLHFFTYDAEADTAVLVGSHIHAPVRREPHPSIPFLEWSKLMLDADGDGLLLAERKRPENITLTRYTVNSGELESEQVQSWPYSQVQDDLWSQTALILWFDQSDTPMLDQLERDEWVAPHGVGDGVAPDPDRPLGIEEIEGVLREYTHEEYIQNNPALSAADMGYSYGNSTMILLELDESRTVVGDYFDYPAKDELEVDYLYLNYSAEDGAMWRPYTDQRIRVVYDPERMTHSTEGGLLLNLPFGYAELVEVVDPPTDSESTAAAAEQAEDSESAGSVVAAYRDILSNPEAHMSSDVDIEGTLTMQYALVDMTSGTANPTDFPQLVVLYTDEDPYGGAISTPHIFTYDPDSQSATMVGTTWMAGAASAGGARGYLAASTVHNGLLHESLSSGRGEGSVSRYVIDDGQLVEHHVTDFVMLEVPADVEAEQQPIDWLPLSDTTPLEALG